MSEKSDALVIESKGWRKDLDNVLQEMKQRQKNEPRGEASRHLALSITHLEDSIMRQGMRLKAINEAEPGAAENPYPESYNPESTKVEPTADGLTL